MDFGFRWNVRKVKTLSKFRHQLWRETFSSWHRACWRRHIYSVLGHTKWKEQGRKQSAGRLLGVPRRGSYESGLPSNEEKRSRFGQYWRTDKYLWFVTNVWRGCVELQFKYWVFSGRFLNFKKNYTFISLNSELK